jgi:hypothetical protein
MYSLIGKPVAVIISSGRSPTQLVSSSHANCDIALSGNDCNVAGRRNPSALLQMALLRVEGWVSLFEGYFCDGLSTRAKSFAIASLLAQDVRAQVGLGKSVAGRLTRIGAQQRSVIMPVVGPL